MRMNDLHYGGAEFSQMEWKTENIEESLAEAYQMAKNLLERMRASSSFSGQMRNELIAFLDLNVQYHGKLIGSGAGQGNALEEAQRALGELRQNISKYYDQNGFYQRLQAVSY